MKSSKLMKVVSLLVLVAWVLGACGGPTPTPEKIYVTQEVIGDHDYYRDLNHRLAARF